MLTYFVDFHSTLTWLLFLLWITGLIRTVHRCPRCAHSKDMVSKALQQRLKYGGTLKEEHRKIILPTSWERANKLFNKTPTLSERNTDKRKDGYNFTDMKKTLYQRCTRQHATNVNKISNAWFLTHRRQRFPYFIQRLSSWEALHGPTTTKSRRHVLQMKRLGTSWTVNWWGWLGGVTWGYRSQSYRPRVGVEPLTRGTGWPLCGGRGVIWQFF